MRSKNEFGFCTDSHQNHMMTLGAQFNKRRRLRLKLAQKEFGENVLILDWKIRSQSGSIFRVDHKK